jgi:hypothetical protein
MRRPFQIFDSALPILFNANTTLCFIVNLHSSVTEASIRNIIPGGLYTFIFHQDATGQHTFTWPSQCVNAIPVNPSPDSTTIQNFIGQEGGGSMAANLPGTWIG